MKIRRRLARSLLTGVVSALLALSVNAAEIAWKPDQFLNKNTFEEDVRVVLRQVLRQNGIDGVIFRPGVEGSVTFEFANMPLEAAFNKLVVENELDYLYDAKTNTITLFNKTSQKRERRLVTVKHISLDKLKAALDHFGYGDELEITPYAPTNSLLLNGNAGVLGEVEKIIRTLDEDTGARSAAQELTRKSELSARCAELELSAIEEREVRVIPLRFANVSSTNQTFNGEMISVPGIDQTLKAMLSASGVVGGAAAEEQEAATTGVLAECLPKPVISIDQRTNSVIVEGAPQAISRVAEIVRELDREVPLVELEVMIVNADVGVSRNLGVQWGLAGRSEKNGESKLAGSLSTTTADTNTATSTAALGTAVNPITLLPLTQTGATNSFSASFVFNGPRNLLDLQIQALDQQNKAQILSSPKVVTLNNIAAKVTSNEKRRQAVAAADTGLGQLEEVEAGLTLDITPSVLKDDMSGGPDLVRLSVNAKNSSFTAQLTTTEQEIQTQAIVQDAATFVLGGIFTTTQRDNRSGVPGLKDVPVLGTLFRTDTKQDDRSETLFLITPKVLAHQDVMAQDIGVRDYMLTQRSRLSRERMSLQKKLGAQPTATLEEDE